MVHKLCNQFSCADPEKNSGGLGRLEGGGGRRLNEFAGVGWSEAYFY